MENMLSIILYVVSCYVLCHSCSAVIWRASTYPSPFVGNACKRNKNESWVCDPDSVISKSDADEIDVMLEQIRRYSHSPCYYSRYNGYNVGVAIADKVQISYSIKSTAKSFAYYVRENTWKLPSDRLSCDDSVLLMLFKDARYVEISTGSLARKLIPDGAVSEIISKMRNDLSQNRFGAGLKTGVLEISLYLRKQKKYEKKVVL